MEIHQIRSVELSELRSLFNRWITLLDFFARKHNRRRRIQTQDYEALYSSLLHLCRVEADQSEGERRIFFQEMASLIEPWFTLKTFESCKQRILMNLLVQCKEIEQILSGRKNIGPSLRRVAQFGLLTLVVCLLVLALNKVFILQDGGSSVLVEMRMAYHQLAYFLSGTTFLQRFAGCTIVMLLITAQFVRNSKKY